MSTPTPPVARATMLIRRPVSEVFAAFVDPAVTTRFWFSRASGRLESGVRVMWFWDHCGASGEVLVRDFDPDRRLLIEWPTPVEWLFEAHGPDATFVRIAAWGFAGDPESQVAQALDSTEGFNLVIAACKVWLEHGIDPRLIVDKQPADGPA